MIMLALAVGTILVLSWPRWAQPQALNPNVSTLLSEVAQLKTALAELQGRCLPAPILTTPTGAYLLAR